MLSCLVWESQGDVLKVPPLKRGRVLPQSIERGRVLPQTIGSGRVLPTEKKSAEVFLGHLFEQSFVAVMSNHDWSCFPPENMSLSLLNVSRNTA